MAETTASVEVLRIPSLAPWYDRDTFLRTDPSAYPTTGTSIEMEKVPSSVSLLNRIALLWKSQRVGSVEEMSDAC